MNYKSKALDSFKTRLRFYLFHKVIHGQDKVDSNEFLDFDIDLNPEIIRLYTTDYYHGERKEKLRSFKCGLSRDQIYHQIKRLETENKQWIDSMKQSYLIEKFINKFPKDDFLVLEKVEECYYCKTKLSDLIRLMESGQIFKKNERGWTLELDRKDPNKEYSVANCVMACYWCNNAKTDEFREEEFIPIGEQIGKVFQERLARIKE